MKALKSDREFVNVTKIVHGLASIGIRSLRYRGEDIYLMASTSQRSSRLIRLDNIICLRAWGFILYGALPANLALLGVLKIEIGTGSKLLLLPASILPIVITFLLIRSRHRDWYLTANYLNLRSAVSTLIVLVLAATICRISVSIRDNSNFADFFRKGVIESFLLAVVSLVVSSTLFMTVLTKDPKLPGLPSSDFVKLMKRIRSDLRKIKGSAIWEEYISLEDDELVDLAKEIKKDMDQAAVCTGNYLAKRELGPVREDITMLSIVLPANNKIGMGSADKIIGLARDNMDDF